MRLSNIKIKVIFLIVLLITFSACEEKDGSNDSSYNSLDSYNEYTDDEVTMYSTNIASNIDQLGDFKSVLTTTTLKSLLETNIITRLQVIYTEIFDNQVLIERTTDLEDAKESYIDDTLGIFTYDEVLGARERISTALTYPNRYSQLDSTTGSEDLTNLDELITTIDTMKTQIETNNSRNPYYVEIEELYYIFTEDFQQNTELLSKINISLTSVDYDEELQTKIDILEAEIEEFTAYASDDYYSSSFITQVETLLTDLKSDYSTYLSSGDVSDSDIALLETTFASQDEALMSYSSVTPTGSSSTGELELAYCDNAYELLVENIASLDLSNTTASTYYYKYIYPVLVDYNTKSLAYGNFAVIASNTVNVITTFQYLQGHVNKVEKLLDVDLDS